VQELKRNASPATAETEGLAVQGLDGRAANHERVPVRSVLGPSWMSHDIALRERKHDSADAATATNISVSLTTLAITPLAPAPLACEVVRRLITV
jgi:hypothetical protein